MSATPPGPFELRVYFRGDVLGSPDTAVRLAATLVEAGGELAPRELLGDLDAVEPLTPAAVRARFGAGPGPDALHMQGPGGVEAELHGYGPGLDPGSMLLFRVPFARLEGEGGGERVVSLARALCGAFPPAYGWGHSADDVRLGDDPHRTKPWAEKRVYAAYWLTILGAPLVRTLKRAHVEATPAHRVEVLPDGAALIVTTPSPAELLGPAAREAQSRALAHLAPERDAAKVLAELTARSEQLRSVAPA